VEEDDDRFGTLDPAGLESALRQLDEHEGRS
jgi:hypothetical protein